MSRHTADSGYGQSGTWEPAEHHGGIALERDQLRVRLLDCIVGTCSNLVNGVFLISTKLDGDSERIDLSSASKEGFSGQFPSQEGRPLSDSSW